MSDSNYRHLDVMEGDMLPDQPAGPALSVRWESFDVDAHVSDVTVGFFDFDELNPRNVLDIAMKSSFTKLNEHEKTVKCYQCPWRCYTDSNHTEITGCCKEFCRKSDLGRHFRIHTQDRPFACGYGECGKSFIQRSALTVHERTHTGDKPHICDVVSCRRPFSDSSSLARHRRIHSGNKPFACTRGCEKSFCRKITLSRHEPKCTGKRGPPVPRASRGEDLSPVFSSDSSALTGSSLNGSPRRADEMIDFNNLSSTEYSPVQAESDAINELSFSTQAAVYTQENLGAGTPDQHSATSMTADCADDRLRMIQSLNQDYQNYNSNPSDVSAQQFMAAQQDFTAEQRIQLQLQQQLPANFANLALNHGEVSMNNVNALSDEWMLLYPATDDVPSSLQNTAQANQNISSMPTYYYDKDKFDAGPEYNPFAGPTRLPLNPVDIELPGDRYSQS